MIIRTSARKPLSSPPPHFFSRLPWHITPRTIQGIGLGSSRAQLLAALGPPDRDLGDVLDYNALGMTIELSHNKIDCIFLHRPELGMGDITDAIAKEFDSAKKPRTPASRP